MSAVPLSSETKQEAAAAADLSKYRFLLMPPFRLPSESKWGAETLTLDINLPKVERLMNRDMVLPYLEDVEWDLHPGALASYGDWPVETREEFAYAADARLRNVREACEGGQTSESGGDLSCFGTMAASCGIRASGIGFSTLGCG